jgi:Prp8 binding protein
MLLSGHADAVLTCKFNPLGTVVASGSQDKHIFLWNVQVCFLHPRIFQTRAYRFVRTKLRLTVSFFQDSRLFVCRTTQGECDNFMMMKGHRNAITELHW